MASHFTYYDTDGKLQEIIPPYGSDRHSLKVRYRTIAARMGAGSVAVFPAPHRYFMARDYTTNQGYLWYSSWRGRVGLGIRQYPDDDTKIDPWMNAPPGTVQEMSLFLLPELNPADTTLQDVLKFTHKDHFVNCDRDGGCDSRPPGCRICFHTGRLVRSLNRVASLLPAGLLFSRRPLKPSEHTPSSESRAECSSGVTFSSVLQIRQALSSSSHSCSLSIQCIVIAPRLRGCSD